jgi:ferritin
MKIANLLDKPTEDILNRAVHSELYASHLYKHVANQMQRAGFFGAQKFFAKEASTELEHYQLIADYMNDRGAMAKVPALEACTDVASNVVDAIELGYETEVSGVQVRDDSTVLAAIP